MRKIAFQVAYGPIPKLVWARSCRLGLWRMSRRRPTRYRRMMAFERRKRKAPYLIADYPYRVDPRYITDFL